jgi:HAD superfamily hydrolase (TIGR01509 family)
LIKAVIFDFYSVLVTKDYGSYAKAHYPNDETKKNQTTRLYEQLGLGQIGYNDFINELAHIGDTSREEVLKYTEDYQANRQLLDYIRTNLKPEYKLGIISNAGDDRVTKIIGPDNAALFDDIVLSYAAGVIKPAPAIYKLSTQNLGVEPAECVFIDDILTFCEGAQAVGMRSVWYKDFDQFKTEIEKLLTGSNK